MTLLDSLTSTPVILAGLLGISVAVYAKRNASPQVKEQVKEVKNATRAEGVAGKMAQAGASVMSPPSANLELPKDDPISVAELAKYDGQDPSRPIYVAIKGRVFDVSAKKEMYGKGAGYNVFAGKDASKGLDAIPDYSGLNEAQRKTLDQWEGFFEKRYNIVGKVAP